MAKIQILKDELKRLLSTGGVCVVPDKTFPMSGYIRLTTKESRIKLEASNSVTSMRVYADLDMPAESISFCVRHEDLCNYVCAITDDSITLEVNTKDNYLKVIHDRGEYTLPIVDAMDFPDFSGPTQDAAMSLKIDGSVVFRWLKKSRDFVVTDSTLRPNLNGAYLLVREQRASISATDAHSLYYEETDEFTSTEDFGIIIPFSAFSAICQTIEKQGTIELITDGTKKAWFKAGKATISTCLAMGKFPNVKSIIPKEAAYEVIISRKQLADAMKRVGFSIHKDSTMMEFHFHNSGVLEIQHDDLMFSKTACEKITYNENSEGISFSILLSYTPFNKAINALDGDVIRLSMNQPDKAVIVKEAENDYKTVLLMPMGKPGAKKQNT